MLTSHLFDFYWSDPHFGHEFTLKYRPFDTTEEMDEALIKNHNRCVGHNDTVAWVGDTFFMPVEQAKATLGRLHGRKILIWGGHDGSFSKMLRMGFDAVVYQMDIRLAERVCTLCHFPYQGTKLHNTDEEDMRYPDMRPRKKKGQVLIHGHTHSKARRIGNMIHVGVDAWDFTPASKVDVTELVREVYR